MFGLNVFTNPPQAGAPVVPHPKPAPPPKPHPKPATTPFPVFREPIIKVKAFKWNGHGMATEDHWFHSQDEAKVFVNSQSFDDCKMWDETGVLVATLIDIIEILEELDPDDHPYASPMPEHHMPSRHHPEEHPMPPVVEQVRPEQVVHVEHRGPEIHHINPPVLLPLKPTRRE